MGRAARRQPQRLAEKLLTIRVSLGLSQNEMIRRIGLEDEITQAEISSFERAVRLPPLNVLLAYSLSAGVCTDTLIDDEADLPARLPAKAKHK